MVGVKTIQADADSGSAEPVERVHVECEGPEAALCPVFEPALRRVLGHRSGCYEVRLRPGRQSGELLVVINASGRCLPLSLFFPEAGSLSVGDVERILHSVLEGMGPFFP
jgi:hypothetical protein